jgi:DNA modification methylase
MVTDPPYGVEYDPSWRDGADLGVGERSRGKVQNDDIVDWTDAYTLFEGDVVYVWHAGKFTHIVAKNLEDCGFDIVSQIIWAKQHFALSRGDYHWQHEPCWYGARKGKKHHWRGARDQSTVWEIKNNNSFGNSNKEETWGHGTQKPVECMQKPIENNSLANDYVYDPFGGSGTTLIACEKTGRRCLMMELDEKYCDIIIRRWQKFTGKQATLEETGESFDG